MGVRALAWCRGRRPRGGRLAAAASLLSLVSLSYVAGAAVMHFDLPSSRYLGNAFTGARAWLAREEAAWTPADHAAPLSRVTVDKPEFTYDGFTLCTTSAGSEAALLDMNGEVVHRWGLPFSAAFPAAPHFSRPLPDDRIHWFRCHLFPNGDLLAVYHADGDTPYGYGLVKIDKDSKRLWAYAGTAHHDVDVGEDGRIYTLTQRLVHDLPPGLESIPGPYIADYLVILSPDGRELQQVPILEAYRDSPYALTLAPLKGRGPRLPGSSGPPGPPGLPGPAGPFNMPPDPSTMPADVGDILHVNSVKVLPRSLAERFPLFKPGQVLISSRQLHSLAVVDPEARRVVWAATGLWRSQHDAEFLDNGRLLVFDNLGSREGSRVLEYDPVTQAVPWSYANERSAPFLAVFRGSKQRLPNGNTLVVDPDGCRVFEVTRGKDLVWQQISYPSWGPPPRPGALAPVSVTGARRYAPDELPFLKGGPRARP
jgi:hypothetical protein